MVLKFLADEDFNGRILRGLIRRQPDIMFVRVQDVGLMGISDAEILTWAVENSFVLLTHDVNTMVNEASKRLQQNLPIGGVILVPQSLTIGRVIDDLIILVECSAAEEFEGQIQFPPL